jgi:hypothetical protein
MSGMASRRTAVVLQPQRAFGGIRTHSLVRTKDVLHLVSFEGVSTASGGRTRAEPGLGRLPLPLGYRGMAPRAGIEPASPRSKVGAPGQQSTSERQRAAAGT